MNKLNDPLFMESLVTSIREHGWVHAHNVLDPEMLDILNDYYDRHGDQFHTGTHLRNGVEIFDERYRGDRFFDLDINSPPPEFKDIIDFSLRFAEEMRLLGQKIEDIRVSPTIYPVLTRFGKHYDGDHYVVAYIFYVHKVWDPRAGGKLVIYDKDDNVVVELVPEPGSFVAFLSRKFPHEVRTTKHERRSIPAWFFDKKIR